MDHKTIRFSHSVAQTTAEWRNAMRQLTISDGRASLHVSELCLGTMYFGYRTGEATAFAILDRFLEAGGTFLDTANNYGQWHGDAGESERVIGRWRRSRGVTSQVVVATK